METVAIRPGQLFIWHGPALFIADATGEVGDADPLAGFYFRETRFLSGLQLRLDGQPPWPCAAGQTAPNELLLGLIHPETGEAKVPRRAVASVRDRMSAFVDGVMHH